MNNSPGEWPVAYHGTSNSAVNPVTNLGFKQYKLSRDAYEDDALLQNNKAKSYGNGKGFYCTPNIKTAESYSKMFDCFNGKESKKFIIAFMCRINKVFRTIHCNGDYWRMMKEDTIRPYRILLKEI